MTSAPNLTNKRATNWITKSVKTPAQKNDYIECHAASLPPNDRITWTIHRFTYVTASAACRPVGVAKRMQSQEGIAGSRK